jgi:radical SAM protein with 4Fe4S-binding SPASM domain
MFFWRKKRVISIDHDGQFVDDKVFCAMPFVHFHIAQDGYVRPCCQAPSEEDSKLGNINEASIQDIWQGLKFESFRAQMLKGKTQSACRKCYEKEAMGWISLREITNEKYEVEINEFIRNKFQVSTYQQPVYFDIRFSNVCNLKCRICNFASSSSWYNDDVALGNADPSTTALTTTIVDETKFYEEFKAQIGTIKEIYFAGGEPLMMEQHYQILDFLIESGNTQCKLFYNTNLSRLMFRDHDVLAYWKKFEAVNLAVSLDDIGERLEYQRKNAKWQQMVANFDRIKYEAANVDLIISPTISIFNVLSIAEMHQTLVEANHVLAEDVVPTLLIDPREFNIQNLTPELKQLAHIRIENHLEWLDNRTAKDTKKMNYVIRQYRNILTYMSHAGSREARFNLPSKIQQLDVLRDEKFEDVFPEMACLMDSNQ